MTRKRLLAEKNPQMDIDFITSKSGRRLLVLAGRTYIPIDKIIAVFCSDPQDIDQSHPDAPYAVDIYIDGMLGSVEDLASGALSFLCETSELAVEASRLIAAEL